MFKRPKGVSDTDPTPSPGSPGAQTASVDPKQTPPDTYPEDRERDTDNAARSITPSYQARKPTVRTLQSTASSSTSSTPTAANLHVGRGLKLEGKIQSCDSLVIEGDVQATIESGTLTISETGEVRGEATVDAAEINGKFDGTLTVKKCLTINSSGRVTGTVHYGELKVEQGGQVSGEIRAEGAEGASDKPRLASSSSKDESKKSDDSSPASGNSSSRTASMI
ncbi:polymer-forming cytoskeletal protein [Parvibaculum sp.]|jgi:cytoskeletal protein CcmA (bactofilin family)|uniref:bactofilin family protein n=1 Tax=Parvibaculum sp. TaxID=2024848 RepID=UPI0032986902